MEAAGVIFERPGSVAVRRLALHAAGAADVVVETVASGISTGTEKLLFTGAMPAFPGLAYPLVPGYESIGRVVAAGASSGRSVGSLVFVPGAACYQEAAGLFGATASRLVVPGPRTVVIPETLGEEAVLLALAATAHHAVSRAGGPVDLVVGHGVLGRLISRMLLALGRPGPVVWEINPARRQGAQGYAVTAPADDTRTGLSGVIEASGDAGLIDRIVPRLARPAEIVLAGFYGPRIDFGFTAAFMRELRLSIAAEFTPADVDAVLALIAVGRLSLAGLITHRATPDKAQTAYRTAFEDADCLKMVIDWRTAA
ncbi:3-hydroxyethyl bacteriochlorophyllide a dehydrogenase [Rhizobium sp. RU20A]|uniref:chlorophyll synthesis pathway protein BchC n=1 Tax=Rhizobium sp. RU20A TaxID=1907412 RepID=UPI000955D8F7|nr:chlorophyll synthesis pathway protein BchC [Rhizobium sp. RU20A]SIR42558.1 3-hydroxyethyl bacteriochlorophyllide a dehydrogenase [Rhizobium sp. RU20A]